MSLGTPSPDAMVVGGVRIDLLPLEAAVDAVLQAPVPASVHLCNAYTIAAASSDVDLVRTLDDGTLNLPDGMPLVWIARLLGFRHITDRVYGPDLMAAVLERGRPAGTRHYFYGSTPAVLDRLEHEVTTRWPGALVAGLESPPFGQPISDEDLARSVRSMTEAGADVVWVGMGTPKQDLLVGRFRRIGSQRFVAIGAAFDFIAGNKPQAPAWLQRLGLEWLFRLATEPRRLWRRYVFGIPRFLLVVARDRPRRTAWRPR